jgi:glutamine synthetase
VFSDDLIDAYINLKYADMMRVRMAVHPLEFQLYYSL